VAPISLSGSIQGLEEFQLDTGIHEMEVKGPQMLFVGNRYVGF
jgi:hypothetical protein